MYLAGERCSTPVSATPTHMLRICVNSPTSKNPSTAKTKIKDICPIRFFFCIYRRKRKSYQKENAVVELSRSAERDKSYALLTAPPFEKGGRKL